MLRLTATATVNTSVACVTVVVTPVGAPVTATATAPVKLVRLTLAVNELLPACGTGAVAGVSAIAMAGRAETVMLAAKVWSDNPVARARTVKL